MESSLTCLAGVATERLCIRPLVMADAPTLAVLTDDPAITDVVDFLRSPFTIADAERLIGSNNGENCFLGIWRGDDLIGVVGVHAHGDHRVEVGYWVGSCFHRKGYATEAVSSVIAELRRLHPRRVITAECRRGNEGSWTLLHKLGFEATGDRGKRPGRELLAIQQ